MPVYPGFDLLDVAGPWEMFNWAGYEVELVAEKPGLIACNAQQNPAPKPSNIPLHVEVKTSFSGAGKWDALWTPGGAPSALNPRMKDPAYLGFLRKKAGEVKYVCSVCEGALLLAAAGLLDGYTITTHWAFIPCFQQSYPKVNLADGFPRYALDRNRLTGGGISSGLDESLKLIELLSGQAAAVGVQQNTQYYPDPPVSSQIPQTNYCPLDGA
ncbi:MAG TPA: DJ-1/PfpI family protein [Caulobacteraceae bacterium]